MAGCPERRRSGLDPGGFPLRLNGPDRFDVGLALDVRRFVAALTPGLRRYCAILIEPNISEAARIAGLRRSAVYESVARLRVLAAASGLEDYLVPPRQIGSPVGK